MACSLEFKCILNWGSSSGSGSEGLCFDRIWHIGIDINIIIYTIMPSDYCGVKCSSRILEPYEQMFPRK